MPTMPTVLEKTACIQLDVTLWTGRRRLRPEDLGDVADKLPPEELASPGSIKLCNPKRLAQVKRVKRRAERACRRLCVQFMRGYATDECNIPAIVEKLSALQGEFRTEADSFVQDLQAEIDDWVDQHPVWAAAIRNQLPNPARVASRLQFAFQVFRIAPTKPFADPGSNDCARAGLEQAFGGLAGRLFYEIQLAASEALKRSFMEKDGLNNKERVGRKALRPIQAIQVKLESLRYLDVRCQPVIDRITQVLGMLPKQGPIEGSNLFSVLELLNVLKDTHAMLALGATVLAGSPHPFPLSVPSNRNSGNPVTPPTITSPAPLSPPSSERPGRRNGSSGGEALWFG